MPSLRLDTSSSRLMQSISTLQQRQRGCQRPATPPPPVEIMPCQPYSSITRDECRKNKMRRVPCLCDRCCPVPFNQGDPEEERNPLGADVVIVREKCCMRDMDDDDIDWKRIGCFFGEPKIAGARRRWTFVWLDPNWRDAYTERELWDMSDEVPPEQSYVPRAARRAATAPVGMSTSSPSLAAFSTSSSLSSYARTASTAVTPRASSSDITNSSIYSIPLSTSPAGYSVKCSSEQPLDTAIAHASCSSSAAVAIPAATVDTDALPASFSRAATDLSTSSQSTASSTAFSSTFSCASAYASTPATPYSATCYSPSSAGSFSTQAGTPFPLLSCLSSPVSQKPTASSQPPRFRQDSAASQLSNSGSRWSAQPQLPRLRQDSAASQQQGRPSMHRACTVGDVSAGERPPRKFSALKGLRGMFAPSAATVATCDARRPSKGDDL